MAAEDPKFRRIFSTISSNQRLDDFLNDIGSYGIRRDDPRLQSLVKALKEEGEANLKDMDQQTFSRIVSPLENLLSKYAEKRFVVPDFEGFTRTVQNLYEKLKSEVRGHNAQYIPQLKNAPDRWGISICTVDGQRFSIGDSLVPFSIQSCSKTLSYAIALESLTSEKVHQYVGHEPSGRIFNEMVLDFQNKPHNPMINAGAIVVASLLHELIDKHKSVDEKLNWVKEWISKAAGDNKLGYNDSIFHSEKETAFRNYALGYFMMEKNVFPPNTNLMDSMDLYFKMCSIESTLDDLSVIAATFANGGVCPTTEDKVFSIETMRDVLSLMHSCGMYDYSGQFAFNVGLPSKSGVAGSLMVILPNLAGICCFSPKLDEHGNSVRGVRFFEELLKVYAFHPYDNLRHTNKRLLN